jgi:hypothetical protein
MPAATENKATMIEITRKYFLVSFTLAGLSTVGGAAYWALGGAYRAKT